MRFINENICLKIKVDSSNVRNEFFDIFLQLRNIGAIDFMNNFSLQSQNNFWFCGVDFKCRIFQFLKFLMIHKHDINSFFELINDRCLKIFETWF